MTEVPQVALDAVQFYRGRSLTKDAAVAIVSVLWYESKLNPGSQGTQSSETPGTLNPGGAYGVASWNGPRQAKLAEFASKKGLNVGERNTQLAFVLTESANSYPKTWAAIKGVGLSYSQIIPTIVTEYENPKDSAAEISGAMEFASKLYAAVPAWEPIQPQIGVPTLPPIDPILIATLVQLFAPIAESLISGLVKGITQHIAAQSGHQVPGQLPLPLPQLPGFDSAALAKLIAKELASLQAGVKQ